MSQLFHLHQTHVNKWTKNPKTLNLDTSYFDVRCHKQIFLSQAEMIKSKLTILEIKAAVNDDIFQFIKIEGPIQ